MKASFFSVIVPTYNRSGIINKVIDIILQQSFHDFELIVVDDGSTDNTAAVLEKYAINSNFRYHYQSNKGVSSARNQGACFATGKFLLFIDSDDVPSANILSDFHEILSANSDYLLAFSQMEQAGRIKGLKSNKYVFNLPVSVIPGTYCIERFLFLNTGGFDEQLLHSENWELMLRIGHHPHLTPDKITVLQKVTLSYSARYSKEKLLFNKQNKIRSYSSLFEKHKHYKIYPKKLVSLFAQIAANNYAGLGDFYRMLIWTKKSIQTYPYILENYYKPILIYFKRKVVPYSDELPA